MKSVFLVVAVTILLSAAPASQASTVINVDGWLYGDPNQWAGNQALAVQIDPGMYLCELVNPEIDSRATYWSFKRRHSSAFWYTPFIIRGSGLDLHLGGESTDSYSREAAFANTPVARRSAVFVATTSTIYVCVSDDYVGDNEGGVSLRLTAVPEPSSFLALAGGLAGMAQLRRRRRPL